MYQALINYGTEGWQFVSESAASSVPARAPLDEIVKLAISNAHGRQFVIVQVIEWSAVQLNDQHQHGDTP